VILAFRPIEAEEITETIVGQATLLAVLTRSVPLSAVGPHLLLRLDSLSL
jgi:hypothetical protein